LKKDQIKVKVLHDLNELAAPGSIREKLVLTIGAFDGVHIAHRALISGAVMSAREQEAQAVVLSFDPHPDTIVRLDHPPMIYMTDLEDKAHLISEIGADKLIIQAFTPEFALITAQTFIDMLLRVAEVIEIHVGEDFVFGHKAQGNVAWLRQAGHRHGFLVRALAPLEVDNEVVSSTRIRQMLSNGAVDAAARLLNRPYSLKGEVVHGNRRGHLIGFPTANLAIPGSFAIPGNGVYATVTTIYGVEGEGKPRLSVTNIGVRPTFDNGTRNIETFILDYSAELYDKIVRVEFIKKLRDERKFSGIEAIREQLGHDVENARAVFSETGYD
jgi:riboflavin kinase/FMN adenylyltransferase